MDTNANTGRNPQSAAEVWALFKETDRWWKERMAELTQKQEETDRQMKETDRQMKESAQRLDKQFGKLGNRFGDVVEHLVAPGILKKFKALGYSFDQVSIRSKIEDGTTGRTVAETDLWLTDGEYVMAVEVKAHPDVADVDEHIERLQKIRAHYDGKGDTRKILGAVAGAVFSDNVRRYAIRNGFYTIVQSGDTVSIDVPEGFQPREW